MAAKPNVFRLFIKHSVTKCIIGEFISTFVLVVISCGAVAQCVFSGCQSGHVLSSFWGGSMGVMLGINFSYKISGAHMNPSITFGLAAIGKLSWLKVPIYIISQLFGAFMASVFVYGLYYDALNDYDNGMRNITGELGTAHIWATYPKDSVSVVNAVFEQIFNTALLMGCVLAVTDPNNMNPSNGLIGFLIGMVVFAISCSFCYNTGAAMNPARDLGPRLFTAIAGWGFGVFSYNNYTWFWIPIVCPPIGAILAAFAYKFLISIYLEENEEIIRTKKKSYKDKDYLAVNIKMDKKSFVEQQENPNML